MRYLSLFLVLFIVQNGLLHAAEDQYQSALVIEHALQDNIKEGNYVDFSQRIVHLATIARASHLTTIEYCLNAHHRALAAERRLLNNEVSEQVAAIRKTIKERFDAQVARYMEAHAHQEFPAIHNVDYDEVANTFVYEEMINRAPWWCFWLHDYNREYALKTFNDLRDLGVDASANNIHTRIEGLSKEDKEAYIAREQQETAKAAMLVQKMLDTHFEKVYARYESFGEVENWHYERKRPGKEAEWRCIIS